MGLRLAKLEHTLQMLLLMGRQVVRSRLAVILDIKELATPTLVRTQLVVHIFPPTGDGMCRCCQKSLDVSRRWH